MKTHIGGGSGSFLPDNDGRVIDPSGDDKRPIGDGITSEPEI